MGGEVIQGHSFNYGGWNGFPKNVTLEQGLRGEAVSHPAVEEHPKQRHELLQGPGGGNVPGLFRTAERKQSGVSRRGRGPRGEQQTVRATVTTWVSLSWAAPRVAGARSRGLTRSDVCPTGRSCWLCREQTAGKTREAGSLSRVDGSDPGRRRQWPGPGWLEMEVKSSVWSLGPSDSRADKVP